MNSPSWMRTSDASPRKWARRNRGRRATDRALRLETILGGAVILAWTWGVYEVTLLFLR
jgi:hypothetical protein